ncbi:MAG: indole-3-glycerol phosphate synthase TrpC [Acidobacteria bacterium]|nr:MAG: indole-3-glycerol phosphate synthase TrpC [Acidobacteriota bacterium]PYY23599.1 MAG: indole-3-glycerol phosphate synthase TrpC [Acidobacteriota bacterium]
MASILQQILSQTRARLSAGVSPSRLRELEKMAANHKPRGFRQALLRADANGPGVIAELKKASPSRGLIRDDFSVAELAPEMADAGAAALSVLTEEKHFQGALQNLRIASERVKIPCLRKDFIVDEIQLLEARAYGGDAALLIVAALSDSELRTLSASALNLELDILCEVHDEQELQRALAAGFGIIGVNNRDLRTFQVSLETSARLNAKIPLNAVRVAESGIHTGAEVARLRGMGYHAFLIGESLMRQPSPGDALRKLRAEAAQFAGKHEVAKQ